jgi:hypothetical protein
LLDADQQQDVDLRNVFHSCPDCIETVEEVVGHSHGWRVSIMAEYVGLLHNGVGYHLEAGLRGKLDLKRQKTGKILQIFHDYAHE